MATSKSDFDALMLTLREQFREARESNRIDEAHLVAGFMVQVELAMGVQADTVEQSEDPNISFVRMRQLELADVERQLRDDRRSGEAALMRWLERVAEVKSKVEAALIQGAESDQKRKAS